jgi:prefoldin subunit 5
VPSAVPTAPFVPTVTKDQERQVLEQQVQAFEAQLDAIRKRLDELSQ